MLQAILHLIAALARSGTMVQLQVPSLVPSVHRLGLNVLNAITLQSVRSALLGMLEQPVRIVILDILGFLALHAIISTIKAETPAWRVSQIVIPALTELIVRLVPLALQD